VGQFKFCLNQFRFSVSKLSLLLLLSLNPIACAPRLRSDLEGVQAKALSLGQLSPSVVTTYGNGQCITFRVAPVIGNSFEESVTLRISSSDSSLSVFDEAGCVPSKLTASKLITVDSDKGYWDFSIRYGSTGAQSLWISSISSNFRVENGTIDQTVVAAGSLNLTLNLSDSAAGDLVSGTYPPLNFRVWVRRQSDDEDLWYDTISISNTGAGTIQGLKDGSYHLLVQGSSYLRRSLGDFTFVGGTTGTPSPNVIPVVGDCDGDNEVSAADLDLYSYHFDVDGPYSWTWFGFLRFEQNPILQASCVDIDRDDDVTVFDFNYISSNFGASGD
jgi:hypothetical protein